MGMAQTEPTVANHVPRLPLLIVAHGFIKTCNRFWRKLDNLSLFDLFLLPPSPHPETNVFITLLENNRIYHFKIIISEEKIKVEKVG